MSPRPTDVEERLQAALEAWPPGDHVLTLMRAAYAMALEDAAATAEEAKLPQHYQWGEDAMEQFDFGKRRAANAIRALAVEVKP
jgi:hypothetical protein